MKNFFKYLALCLVVLLASSTVAFADTERLGSAKAATFNARKIAAKTADYTVLTTDGGTMFNVSASGAARTMTLPAISDVFAASSSFSIKVVKTDSSTNTVTLSPASGDTIGGESARVIVNQNGYIIVRSSGGRNWVVDYESPYIVEDHEAGSSDLGTQGYDASIIFEGATADAFETTLSVVDPTADGTASIPALGSGTTQYFMFSSLSTNIADAANAVTGTSNGVLLEGATADDYETTLTVTDPTADRTVTMPDATGTVAMTTGLGSTTGIYTAPTTSTTFTTADCGKIVGVATDALTHVLPNSTAGCCFTFTNTGAAGNNVIKIDVDSDDQIFGTVTLAASVVAIAGSAGDSVSLTKATSIRGDSMTLCAVGSNVWNIISSTGIWADTN